MALEDFTKTSDLNVSAESSAGRDYNCWDNPDSILSFETYKLINEKLQCSLISCIFLIGAPTNVLSMIIFYRQGLRDRMNLCLFCLAFTDLMFANSFFSLSSYCFIGIFLPEQEIFWRSILTKHTLNFLYGFAYSSSCLTTVIAVERCVCVIFPLKAATLVSTKTMAVILFLTMFLMQLLCGVYIVKENVSFVKDIVTGRNSVILTYTELFLNQVYLRVVENVVLPAVPLASFIVVFAATVVTVVRLRSAVTWRRSAASSYLKGQAVLMKMLVVVSCIYITCTSTIVALALARFTVPEFRQDGRYCNLFLATHNIGMIAVLVNSSINFFVYVTMSSRLRHELRRLFVCVKTQINSVGDSFNRSQYTK